MILHDQGVPVAIPSSGPSSHTESVDLAKPVSAIADWANRLTEAGEQKVEDLFSHCEQGFLSLKVSTRSRPKPPKAV